MEVNPEIFREYDIRGIAERDLTNETVGAIGKSFGTYLRKRKMKEVVVGRGIRASSERIENALIEGLLSAGCNVTEIGLSSTPQLYFSILHLKKDAGINVTGSHNPIEFNGFKIAVGKLTIYGKEIQQLREIIEKEKFAEGKGRLEKAGTEVAYLSAIKERIKIKRKLKVVVDAGNGMASELAPKLFREIGCEVVPIYCRLDGSFPNHLPDPTVLEYMQELIEKVKEEKADLGIGLDGDVDRIGVVDENGKIVFADRILILYAKDVLKKKPGSKIIFDVKCSEALKKEIEKNGGKPLMWKTGHSLIKAKLFEENAPLAGEMSGHMFFADNYYGFDDALFASCRLLQILGESSKSLSELLADAPKYYSTPEIRADCPDDEKFNVVKEVKKHFKEKYKTIDVDGVRVLFKEGWGLVRASNTQPKIILRFEAKTEKGLEKIKEEILEKLREFPEVKIPSM